MTARRLFGLVALAATVLGHPAVVRAQAPSDAAIEQTIQQLIKQIKEGATEHGWEPGPPPPKQQQTTPPDGIGLFQSWKVRTANYGGLTALAVTALLTAGVDDRADEQLAKGIDFLSKLDLSGTYATSFRLQAFSRLADDKPAFKALLQRDAAAIAQSQLANGNWWYIGSADKSRWGTNSNGQLAVLGLWSAAQAGVATPPAVWQRIEKHWTERQNADGGWGYQEKVRPQSYGAMTASGVATLYILLEQLHSDQFVGLRGGTAMPALEKGMAWLGKNFRAGDNVNYGQGAGSDQSHWAYWLYSVERAGQAGGFKHLPGPGGRQIDWFAEGAAQFISRSGGGRGLDLDDACFALMFLAKGSAPTFVHKLQWAGDWNQRPHDMAAACRYIDKLFERRVNWYSVTLDAPVAELAVAPVLWVSGTQPFTVTDPQRDTLKGYLDGGGLLLAENTGGKTATTAALKSLLSTLYPAGTWAALDPAHPILSQHNKLGRVMANEALTVDGKVVAVLFAGDLSRALQTNALASNREVFDLFANTYAWMVKQGRVKRKLSVGGGTVAGVDLPTPPRTTTAPGGPAAGGAAPPAPTAAAGGSGAAPPAGVISATDAAAISQALAAKATVTVEGQVSRAAWSTKGTILRIEFQGNEASKFQSVVFQRDREKVDAAFGGDVAKALQGARIRVSGQMAEYRNEPQIVISDPGQLTVVK